MAHSQGQRTTPENTAAAKEVTDKGSSTKAFDGDNHPFNFKEDVKAVWGNVAKSPLLHNVEIVFGEAANSLISGEVGVVQAQKKYPTTVTIAEGTGYL